LVWCGVRHEITQQKGKQTTDGHNEVELRQTSFIAARKQVKNLVAYATDYLGSHVLRDISAMRRANASYDYD
jgi:hypothetical protein